MQKTIPHGIINYPSHERSIYTTVGAEYLHDRNFGSVIGRLLYALPTDGAVIAGIGFFSAGVVIAGEKTAD